MDHFFDNNGYAIFRAAIELKVIQDLKNAVETLRGEHDFSGGLRRLVQLSPAIAEFAATEPLQEILRTIGLTDAFLVRSILFDKTPSANWKVAWHQDTKIPVREKFACPSFTSWSVKDGIHHTQAPAEILAGMRTLRIHLDDTPSANGALRIVPSSHTI